MVKYDQTKAGLDLFLKKVQQLQMNRSEECKYASFFEMVDKEGKFNLNEPLSKKDEGVLMDALVELECHEPQIKQCYKNAFLLTQIGKDRDLDFEYTEGYGATLIPTFHAWVTWKGRAIDVTWRGDEFTLEPGAKNMLNWVKRNITETPYKGITIPFDYMQRLTCARKAYLSAIDDWQAGWPLIRKDFSFDKPIAKIGRGN